MNNVTRRGFYLDLIRPLMFRLDPETAHHVTLGLLHLAGVVPPVGWVVRQMFNVSTAVQSVKAFGLTFPNGVGLAAGYDKDGLGWRGLAALGFGHIEVGTVTPLPQPGNPAPRVFRLVEDRGVINRMGFPSHGAEIVAQRLQGKRPAGLIVGVNIGKNKDTPNEQASQDYISLLRTFGSLADYLAVNVSSPNTPMLRMLQNRFALEGLLGDLTKEREILCLQTGKLVPLLVKLSPDIPFSLLGQVLEAIVRSGADGVIISNTSLDRSEVQFPHAQEAGGLSGLPLRERALSLLRFTTRELRGQLPVIASGGIMTVEDAQWRLDAGARLVQLYTGMIYSGPSLVGQVARGIHNPW